MPVLALPDGALLSLGLVALFVMSFIGASPVPIPFPLTITIMWLGQFNSPVLVVLAATLGTVAGWYRLESTFKRWIQAPKLQKAIPASYQRFFLRQTGFWLFFFNALPFPWDPMRFLALANDYPRCRCLLVLGTSRVIRYTILVTIGALLAPYKVWFWAALIGFMILPVLMDRTLRWVFARIKPDEPTLTVGHGDQYKPQASKQKTESICKR
jgi:membrane protein YqaA with SNARE-associated domain